MGINGTLMSLLQDSKSMHPILQVPRQISELIQMPLSPLSPRKCLLLHSHVVLIVRKGMERWCRQWAHGRHLQLKAVGMKVLYCLASNFSYCIDRRPNCLLSFYYYAAVSAHICLGCTGRHHCSFIRFLGLLC